MYKTKMIKLLILMSFVINFNPSYSQDFDMDKEVNEILHLGKDSIIDLAIALINNSDLSKEDAKKENFAKIKVLTDGEEVFVILLNPIIYLPQDSDSNTGIYSRVKVNIIGEEITLNSVSHPTNKDRTTTSFYEETEKIKEVVDFILKAINTSDEVGSMDRSTFEDAMSIYEYGDYYEITVDSKSTSSFYKIEKKSGKIYDARHKHKQMESSPPENKVEINWDQFR